MIYPIEPRTRSTVASRFRAGDSVELLAEDYGISPEQVEAALREEWRAEPAPPAAQLLILLNECVGWIAYIHEHVGMSAAQQNRASVLLRKAAALEVPK